MFVWIFILPNEFLSLGVANMSRQSARKYAAVDQSSAEVHGWGASFSAGCGGCIPRLETTCDIRNRCYLHEADLWIEVYLPTMLHTFQAPVKNTFGLRCNTRNFFQWLWGGGHWSYCSSNSGALEELQFWAPNLLEGNKNIIFHHREVEVLGIRWIPTICWALVEVRVPVRHQRVGPTASSQFANVSIIFFGVKTVKKPERCFERLARLIEISAYNGIQIKIRGQELSFISKFRWYLHPGFGLRCGKECEDKMSEITKAVIELGWCFVGAWKLRVRNSEADVIEIQIIKPIMEISETKQIILIHTYVSIWYVYIYIWQYHKAK